MRARTVLSPLRSSGPRAASDDAPGDGPIPARAWQVLALVSTAMFALILDNNAANVAFPFIERAFVDTPRTTLAWVSTGYAIALASLLIVAGRLADRYGRRRIFLGGMALFALSTIATASAWNPTVLIAARVLQGAGSALLTATAVALLLPEFPAARRGLALGIWGTVGSAGAAVGPTLGAVAIEVSDWRLVFLLNVPLAVVVLLLGRRVLGADTSAPPPTSAGSAGKDSRIDVIGTVLGTASIALLTFGILQGPRWGWLSPAAIGVLGSSVVLFALFLAHCSRAASPLLDLGLFSYRTFATANLSQAGTQMAIFAWFFTTPLFLVNVWHTSALVGGSAVAIGMVASFVSIPVGHWSDRNGYRGVLVVGGIVVVAAMAWWVLRVDTEPNWWSAFLPGLLVFGLGAGMVGIVVTNAALAGIPEDELASANAVFQTIRRLSGAIGVALSVVILGGRDTDSLADFRGTWLLIGGGYLLSVLAALAYPRNSDR